MMCISIGGGHTPEKVAKRFYTQVVFLSVLFSEGEQI